MRDMPGFAACFDSLRMASEIASDDGLISLFVIRMSPLEVIIINRVPQTGDGMCLSP